MRLFAEGAAVGDYERGHPWRMKPGLWEGKRGGERGAKGGGGGGLSVSGGEGVRLLAEGAAVCMLAGLTGVRVTEGGWQGSAGRARAGGEGMHGRRGR